MKPLASIVKVTLSWDVGKIVSKWWLEIFFANFICLDFLTGVEFCFCRYPYMAVVLNFSQSWALYCLVQFYTVTKDELEHIKPLFKFLTFKSIVFLTWWQGVAIALFYDLGLFKSAIAQGLQLKSSVQDFIICIEVVFLFCWIWFFFLHDCMYCIRTLVGIPWIFL